MARFIASTADQPSPGPTCDVAIVGAGPVGLYLALRLGDLGHTVVVVEKQPAAYGLPRAVHFDHEVARLLAHVGIADELRTITQPIDMYDWRNAEGKTLIAFEWPGNGPSGWPMGNMFCQPQLEELLADKVAAHPNITVRRGEEVVQIERTEDAVTLTAHGPLVKHRRVTAKFVVGCDGANSLVRQHIGTTMTDLGFFFDWLVIDLLPHEEREWKPINVQICDPARPTTAVAGGPGRRRFEFMRMPGETIAELEDEATVWKLLEPWDYTAENADLERRAVYTFQARWADVWYRDRMAIAGDAAHLMPPFAGQGMCSGIRDAANLAWKVDLLLRGLASEKLLETYTTERAAHVRTAIEESVALGNIICIPDPEAAAKRDEFMLAVGPKPADLMPPIPPARLGPGVVDPSRGGAVGVVAAQPPVRRGHGATGLWDQIVGVGFSIMTPLAAEEVLDEERRAALADHGVRWVQLMPSATALPADSDAIVDTYDAVLEHLAEGGHVAAAVRPDAYLYGVVAEPGDIPRFVDDLLRQLRGAAPTPIPA